MYGSWPAIGVGNVFSISRRRRGEWFERGFADPQFTLNFSSFSEEIIYLSFLPPLGNNTIFASTRKKAAKWAGLKGGRRPFSSLLSVSNLAF